MFELEAIHGGIYKYNFQSESNAQLHPLGPGDAPLLSAGRLSVHGRHTFFQVRWLSKWMRLTVGSLFARKGGRQKLPAHSITPFQALSTALAAAIGTGNIVGVAIALSTGGPGAIFWMWASAFLGMMTSFAEKTLGIRYRYPDAKNRWVGGAMVYMEKGLHCKWMALLFAALCIPVSFGMGNLSQSNSMAQAMKNAFGVSPKVTGAAAAILIGIILLGGIKRIAAVTEKLVPIMAILYLTAGCAVILINIRRLPQAVGGIISEAFSIRSAIGGTAGYGMARALRTGVSMGVFSNEAGLGTSVIVHCDADVKEPVEQGMWGIFEVFADTLVCCTVTALAILTSGFGLLPARTAAPPYAPPPLPQYSVLPAKNSLPFQLYYSLLPRSSAGHIMGKEPFPTY